MPGDRERALARLKSYIAESRTWMLTHQLKLIVDTTEFIIFQSHNMMFYGVLCVCRLVATWCFMVYYVFVDWCQHGVLRCIMCL